MASKETKLAGIAGSVEYLFEASREVYTGDGGEQARASKEIVGGTCHFLESSPFYPFTGDKHGIPSGSQGGLAENLPQSALHLIPCYCVSDAFPDQNSESIMVETIGKGPYHQILVGRAPALPMDLVEPFVPR